jgi:mono/diheme cytochrome c family protein
MPPRAAVVLALVACLLPACQQRMAEQPSARPDQPSAFFGDGRAARPVVAGTVARGHLRADLHLYTGRVPDATGAPAFSIALVGSAFTNPRAALAVALAGQDPPAVDTFPYPITREILQHGRHRYMIYCVVCHDPLGTGRGMIVERGYTAPQSYHIERLRTAPVGHFFEVITKGYGSMPAYRIQIPPRDRWAIAAYVRVLQHSQHFPESALTAAMRQDWQKQKTAASGGPAP